MKKTDKTSDKRGKKSGEIAEEKLDKVAGGLGSYQLAANVGLAGSIYETGTHPTVPTVPKVPIIKP